MLLQLTPHGRLVSALSRLCWGGQGLCYALFGAEHSPGGDGIPAIPRVRPWFHLVANWQNFSAGALPVSFRCSNLQPVPVHSCLYSVPRNRNVCEERGMGLVIKHPPL